MLAGDYNVVPSRPWTSVRRSPGIADALLQPESRAAYERLLAQGWTDAIRALHPKEPMYTFWDYMRKRWERDGGLRLDHILLSPVLKERLQSAGVDRHIRGIEDASDHAPVWAELRDASDRPPLRALLAATQQRSGRHRRKLRNRPVERMGRLNAKPARLALASLNLRLLVVGDRYNSFAHRSYQCVDGKLSAAAMARAGKASWFRQFFLLRFYADDRPRGRLLLDGTARRADKASRNVSRLSERARVR